MNVTPRQARLALATWAMAAGLVAFNVLCLQDAAVSRAPLRAKPERAKSLIEAERPGLPLALAGHHTQRPTEALRISTATLTPTAAGQQVGLFAASAANMALVHVAAIGAEERAVEIVRAVQRGLAVRGYEPGPADGGLGIATRAAVMAYEHDHGLALTAEPSESILTHMRTGALGPAVQRVGRARPMSHAEQIIRSAQHSLSTLGYFAGRIDGLVGEDTVRAIREYEMDVGLVSTGRISAALVNCLAGATADAGRRRRPTR